jgi:hypothetical protein
MNMASEPTIMAETGPSATPSSTPTPLQGLFIVAAVIVAIVAYLALCTQLRLTSPYAGFLFLFYWTGVKQAAAREYPPALLGALGGVALAFLLYALPPAIGTAGFAVALLAICAAIYALVMGWLPLVVNNAMMLLLTVGTIEAIQRAADFAGMAASILLAAALGGLLLLVSRAMARRGSASTPG